MGGEVKVTSEIGKGSVFSIISRMMCLVEGDLN
jgi:signal transduction histidine kinase